MKKIIILLISLALITIGILSGCIENNQQNEQNGVTPIETDTDGDGYADDIDAFPLDSNLHEKAPFNELNPIEYNITLAPSSGQGPYSQPNITSEWKYIICNWYVTELELNQEQAESIVLEVRNPITGPSTTYYYNDSNSHELSFTIKNDNLGVWSFEFSNIMTEGINTSPVTITLHIELYKIR